MRKRVGVGGARQGVVNSVEGVRVCGVIITGRAHNTGNSMSESSRRMCSVRVQDIVTLCS